MDFSFCLFGQHFPVSSFTKITFNHKLKETSPSPMYLKSKCFFFVFLNYSKLISCQHVFAKSTKIGCPRRILNLRRIINWKEKLERQVEVSTQKLRIINSSENVLPRFYLLLRSTKECVTKNLPLFSAQGEEREITCTPWAQRGLYLAGEQDADRWNNWETALAAGAEECTRKSETGTASVGEGTFECIRWLVLT